MMGRALVIVSLPFLVVVVVELLPSSFVVLSPVPVVLGGAVCDGPPAVIDARDELVEPDELRCVPLFESVVIDFVGVLRFEGKIVGGDSSGLAPEG